MKEYQYYLFDWDGCLANTTAIWLEAYKKTFAMYGVHPSMSDIARRSLGKASQPPEYGITDYHRFGQELIGHVNDEIKNTMLSEGAKEMLTELKKNGKKMAIVSSSHRDFIQAVLQREGIEDYFDFIIDHYDVANLKPDPEGIHKAVAIFKANLEDVVMVGDSSVDVGAGTNAGVATILFYPDNHKDLYSEAYLNTIKSTYKINHFTELMAKNEVAEA